MASAGFAFKKDDEVLAYHGPLIYGAKVVDRTHKDPVEGAMRLRLYLLHYEGCVCPAQRQGAERRLLR